MNNVKNYIRFSSDNRRFDFTFLYPADWQPFETKGKETDYDAVNIIGPRNREDTYSLGLSILVEPAREVGGQYASAEEVVADYLSKHKHLPKFREISRTHGSLAGIEATEIEISYTTLLPLNTVHPKETSIIERRIFLKKDGYVYQLIYTAVEEDYYKYLEAFKDAARTFEFQMETDQEAYAPCVMPLPAYAIREGSAEYKTDQGEV